MMRLSLTCWFKGTFGDTPPERWRKKVLGLLKLLSMGERDLVDGKVLSQEDFFSDFDQALGSVDHD